MIWIYILFGLITKVFKTKQNLITIPYKYFQKSDGCSLSGSVFCDIQNIAISGDIKIGYETNSIPVFFDLYNELSDINNKFCNVKDKNLNDNSKFFYNYKMSKTCTKLTDFNKKYFYFKNSGYIKDDFYLTKFIPKSDKGVYDLEKDYIAEQIFFVLTQDIIDNKNLDGSNINCLKLGLGIISNSTENELKEYNFVYQLKHKSKIKNYIFTFDYEKNKQNLYNNNNIFEPSGKLIIGDYPHNYFLDKYKEYQFVEAYADKYLGNLNFQLTFEDVYIKKKNSEVYNISPLHSYIDPNNAYIIGSISYKSNIYLYFFDKYIKSNICHSKSFEDQYFTIYCDKNNNFNINHLKEFPSLNFYHKYLNNIFTLTYEDLFIEKDNKYFFLVYFKKDFDESEWSLGIPFLNKYQLTFNLESKKIGFYNQNLKPIPKYKYIQPKSLIIFLIFFFIVFTLLAFCLGNNIYKYSKETEGVELEEVECNLKINPKKLLTKTSDLGI